MSEASSAVFYHVGADARRLRMLGCPPPSSYFGASSMDRLRNYIPASYLHQTPKILPPQPLSPAARTASAATGLLSPSHISSSPRHPPRLVLNSPTGNDIAATLLSSPSASSSSSSRSLKNLDFVSRSTASKVEPTSTPSLLSSTCSPPSPSRSVSSSSVLSSGKSSSSLLSLPPSYPPNPVFPGLMFNQMTSAIALKMGMINSAHQQQSLAATLSHPPAADIMTKPSSKSPTAPVGFDLARNSIPTQLQSKSTSSPTSAPSSSSSSSSLSSSSSSSSSATAIQIAAASTSSTSSMPSTTTVIPGFGQAPLIAYPRFFTSFLSQEEQQQYIAMANLQAVAKGQHGMKNTPFASRNYLELAMLVCNTFRGKLFPCPHCRYVTDRRNNLKRHVATMHQACDKQLECCGVTFATKASLREHIAIFHHNGYSCTFCGRRFCRKALLKRHLSVHNGQKDYTCPHCDYATSHKSNLERHKRIHARIPENGESFIFGGDRMPEDAIMEDSDFKHNNNNNNNNIIKLSNSSSNGLPTSGIDIPYYYQRLHKSFAGQENCPASFLNGKDEKSDAKLPEQRDFMNNLYFFNNKNEGTPSRNFSPHHMTDLSTTSITSTDDDDNSDSDIDIDSFDDNEISTSEKQETADDGISSKPPSSYFLEQSHDDNYPLNLVKTRQGGNPSPSH